MERIDLTFYNNRFSIYRYIFSHMWNLYSKKPEYYNNDGKMRPFDASNKQKSFHRKNDERRDSNYEKDTD